MNYDAIIIGGGAAGLFCAFNAAKRGHKILLIDHFKRAGEKIRISGGGRCNFTNIHTDPKNFISQNPHFCVSALQRYKAQDFIELITKHQITFHEKTLGQLFCDYSSSQIINMLLDECDKANVEIILETSVKEVKKNADKFYLKIETNLKASEVNCQSLVIATGGLSIPKIGASSFGYDIARQFGINVTNLQPALVPLIIEEQILQKTKSLAGISFKACVSFKNTKFFENVLFTHRGLSGPAILQISSYINNGEEITIDMLPDNNLYEILLFEKAHKPRQEISTILAKFLPKNLANFISDNHNFLGHIADMPNSKLQEIASLIKNYKFKIIGNEGYLKAEVTKGGVDVDEISSKTFESKKVKGLYFIGEVLDVTGHLGGFNFQFAWSSAYAAAQFI